MTTTPGPYAPSQEEITRLVNAYGADPSIDLTGSLIQSLLTREGLPTAAIADLGSAEYARADGEPAVTLTYQLDGESHTVRLSGETETLYHLCKR